MAGSNIPQEAEQVETTNDTESIQASGFFATTRFERIILLAVVIASLVMHIPPLLDPDITLLGEHWLFVTYPLGMVGITTWWLVVTYVRG